ncbi:MAG: GNAT family N-acetyltransferase [Paracoccaceae bacterium]
MSDTVSLYRLGPADLALLMRVPEGVFDNPINPAQAAAFLGDPRHEMVLALLNDIPVGMGSAVIMLHPDKPPAGFINEVGVHPDHRRRGIGSAICTTLFKQLRLRGCAGIWLATEHDNTAARGLYTRLEGRKTTEIVVYDWDGAMGALPAPPVGLGTGKTTS